MTDRQLGLLARAARVRRRWRQSDLADRAGVTQTDVSRLERGRFGAMSVGKVRRILTGLDIPLDLVPRSRGGELDRLINRGHSALHEQVARRFGRLPDWLIASEASFAIYGERGIVDILAWHQRRRALLVIELKTAIVDVNELLGTLDRKRRLATRIAREHGWAVTATDLPAATVSTWLIVAATRTNRRRVDAHHALLRTALPDDGRAIDGWLADPQRPIAALCYASLQDDRALSRSRVRQRVREKAA